MSAVKDTQALLANLDPVLQPGTFVFCSTRDGAVLGQALASSKASFAEDEGVSLIVPVTKAEELGFDLDLPMRQITLSVRSALDSVGLTATVAQCLADENIPCNVVAAAHHDHVFVPAEHADDALAVLEALQERS